MAIHRTQVLNDNGTHTPICHSCGWVGEDHTSQQAARSAASRHILEKARGSKTDPRQVDLLDANKTRKS